MIRCEGLTIGYGEHIILRDVNFTFPNAPVIALMGASGLGKTTLLKALGGLITPLAGKITGLEGKKIAFMFQEDRLLPWCSALQNAALAGTEQKARAWLQKLGILSMEQYPDALSGGMRRRVALARALCFEGDMLLLDEPFKGLDEETRAQVIGEVLKTKIPIILTTHDIQEAKEMNAQIVRIEEMIA